MLCSGRQERHFIAACIREPCKKWSWQPSRLCLRSFLPCHPWPYLCSLPSPCPCSGLQLQRLVAGSADGPAVIQLLDELMAVAMERCLEPLLLESSVLDRILAAAAAAKGGGAAPPPMSLL